ncbi:MAG: NACHT domain-containing NTPase [Pseudonocardiaceae bacterium]
MAPVMIGRWPTPRVWAGLGLLGLAGVVGLVAVVLLSQGWEKAAQVAGVVAILLAVAPPAVQLLAWSRRRPSPVLTVGQVAQARELLAARVAEQWRRESAARSLGNPEPMPVRWVLTEQAVMDHRYLVLTGSGFAGSSAEIDALADEFARLIRRRLVILGPAGAGKTTLAVQLLLHLLATWKPEQPVPVLLSLAGWDLAAAPRLQDWLADRLARDYPAVRAVHPDAARALAEQGCVLPVLDGLDELPDDYRPKVITAINSSLPATDPLVLTCRTDEFRDAVGASDVLRAAAVIEPKPLGNSEAAAYLVTCPPPEPGESWRTVLAALREGNAPALAGVCTTRWVCGWCAWSTSPVRPILPRCSPTPMQRPCEPNCSTSSSPQ